MAGGVEQGTVTGGPVRLDRWLAALASVGSRQKAREVLERGKVTVDGASVGPADAGRSIPDGAVVAIAWNRPGTGEKKVAGRLGMERAGVVVRWEDPAALVVDKPAGLLTDAADADQAKFRDTLRKRVRAFLGAEVWPAHRIDRDTSGLVLFARSEAARERLLEQWHARTPLREYLLIVEGRFPRQHGAFADWMAWDGRDRLQKPCDPDAPGAWLAEAKFEVAERFGDTATMLRVRLVTGRRNQIRLHCQLAHHPLVGEPLYRRHPARVEAPRQALHAARLGFRHPTTDAPVEVTSPLPPDLEALVARLRR